MSLRTRARNRAGRLWSYRWRTRSYVSSERPIVIGGSPRSGTTLLRRILDSHSRICSGPESGLFLPGRVSVEMLERGYGLEADQIRMMLRSSGSQAEFVEWFFRTYRERQGKPRWSEKTPLNVWHLDWIWKHFPEASFVHVIRDGRDVACSMRLHPDRHLVQGRIVEVRRDESMAAIIQRWVVSTGKGLKFRGDPRYREVRYEDLVTRPRETLEPLLESIGEPFEQRMLAERADGEVIRRGAEFDAKGALVASSVGRWQHDLSPADIELVERLGGPRLRELGYPL
ncbi:MAG: sulfotransferase [Chloroflexi bacterium]|nr:sulfotransferase [Chloroflexota bacterium]